MTSLFGYKLNPHRKMRTPKGLKGTRRTVYNTHTPDTITRNGILTVRFPDLGPNDVIVPGSQGEAIILIDLNGTDVNRTIVINTHLRPHHIVFALHYFIGMER